MQNTQQQNVAFTQQQQDTFAALLRSDGMVVHGVELRGEMMLLLRGALMMAHTDAGCVYTDGSAWLMAEGEQQEGELYLNESYVGTYTTNGVWLKLHLEGGHLCYGNDDEGWDDMAFDVLSGEYKTMDLC